ncbi:MAG: hypothetical protein CVV27_16650, partial [Candidatus Melainabacteria bacterium HGW-Melainabacteria-1]
MSIWSQVPLWLGGLWLLRGLLLALQLRFSRQDQLLAAVAFAGLALLIWPFSAPVWTQLGNLLGDLKSWPAARRCFGLARRLRPDWIEAWLGLGVAALVLEADALTAHSSFLRAYCLRRGVP